MWLFLRPIMLWLAHGKISHWWHWNKVKVSPRWKGQKIQADPKHSFKFRTGLVYNSKKAAIGFDQVRMSLGGWKSAVILEPTSKVSAWQYAFASEDNPNEAYKCAIILEGPIRVLRGPKNTSFYGFDMQGNNIPLTNHSPHERHDRQYLKYPLV